MKVKAIILLIGTLGTTLIRLRNWLKEIGTETQITELQKTELLNTPQILRKVLEILRKLVVTGP